MSRSIGVALFSVFTFLCNSVRLSAQDGNPSQSAIQIQTAQSERLLVNAYLAGMNLAPQDRASLLGTLSSAAAKIQPSLCRLWSEELFKLSFSLPMNWNRIAYQKNAVVALSAVDSARAFELLGQIDAPVPLRSDDFPEDLRADAANAVFPQYWNSKGPAVLEQLRSQAERIGSTGQYPYVAMAPILVDIAKTNENPHSRIIALFADALAYYGRGSKFDTEDEDFIAFLEEVWNVIPRNFQQQGLELAVRHLSQKLKPREGEVFSGQVSSKSGAAQFRSHAEQELYNLMPRIREINPKWAETLVNENAVLAQAEAGTDKASFTGAAVIRYSSSEARNDRLGEARSQAAQLAQFDAAMRAASTNPDEALRMANALGSELRLQVYSRVAADLVAEHAEQASNLMQQVQKALDSMVNESTKFKVLVNLASVPAALHDNKTFAQIFTRAFRLGEELFEEDLQAHPGKLAYQTVSFEGLSRLTVLGAQVDMEATLPRIEKIENEALRANLLAVAAQAVHDLQARGRGAQLSPAALHAGHR